MVSQGAGAGRPRIAVLIPAAGSGRRMDGEGNKILAPLAGQPMILRTARVFQEHPRIHGVWIVARPGDFGALDVIFQGAGDKLAPWVAGGEERQDSVYNGLAAMAADPPGWVLVHDGARPCCPPGLIGRVLDALSDAPGVIPTLPVSDTLRRIGEGPAETVSRDHLRRVQTPQGFHWAPLWEAHSRARRERRAGTDEAQLFEGAGFPLAFVEGELENLKITTGQDRALAEKLVGGGN